MTSTYQDDHAGYWERLNAKLQPARIRSTLAFAGLCQITHEMIKQVVVKNVREYYCLETAFDGRATVRERREYEQEVLSLAPGDRFRASLLWLVNLEAITRAQADRLGEIYDHRHVLTHELIRYIIDPDVESEVDLLLEAIAILKGLHRFWIETNIGLFITPDGTEIDDVDPEDVQSLQLVMLRQCVSAYLDGLTPATEAQR